MQVSASRTQLSHRASTLECARSAHTQTAQPPPHTTKHKSLLACLPAAAAAWLLEISLMHCNLSHRTDRSCFINILLFTYSFALRVQKSVRQNLCQARGAIYAQTKSAKKIEAKKMFFIA